MRNISIKDYKNQALNIFIVLIALYIARAIYLKQEKATVILRGKTEMEAKKIPVLEDIGKLEKKIKLYKNFINNKDISNVIDRFNEIAQECSVDIISIKPATQGEDAGFYFIFRFFLRVETKNYNTLGEFISRLESDRDVYDVEFITAAPEMSQFGGKVNKMTLELRIDTFIIKD